jgi:hypothetical protein
MLIIITLNTAIIAPTFQNYEDQDLQNNNFANRFVQIRYTASHF